MSVELDFTAPQRRLPPEQDEATTMREQVDRSPTTVLDILAAACPMCGTKPDPAWVFCGMCGGELTDLLEDAEPEVAEPRRVRRRGTSLVAVVTGLCLLVLVVAALGAVGWVKLTHSQDTLTRTRTELAGTRADVVFTKDALRVTRDELDNTASTLAATEAQLDSSRSRLSKTRGSLDNAQDRLDLQAGQIDTLQSCLGGVSSALSYAAGGYYGAALTSLQSVESDCQAAQDIL